jgi:DNA polymerase III subunit gamma/tau
VFILDEAHMLSKAAGNALLKTLEEPPEHVHFVLATTEPYKLLDTIRSRSQRFDFHAISIESLAAHLGTHQRPRGFKTDPAALTAVARHALGSARDSLSLLEQVAALGNGGRSTPSASPGHWGLADGEAYNVLADAINVPGRRAALELVAELASEAPTCGGSSPSRCHSSGVSSSPTTPPTWPRSPTSPAEILNNWKKAAKLPPAAEVLRAVDVLGEALIKLREGREERLMLELAMIKLTRPEVTSDPEALAARIGRLERRVETFGETPPVAPAQASPPRPAPAESRKSEDSDPVTAAEPPAAEPADVETPAAEPEEPAGEPVEQAPDGPPLTLAQLQSVWPGLFGSLRDVLGARRWALFREVIPATVEGSAIVLHVPHLFHLEQLQEDPAVAKVVATKAGDLLGRPVSVRFVSNDGSAAPEAASSPDEEIDLASEQLFEGPTEETDPAALLAAELGAEVVDDD